jgi:hypothetical protein
MTPTRHDAVALQRRQTCTATRVWRGVLLPVFRETRTPHATRRYSSRSSPAGSNTWRPQPSWLSVTRSEVDEIMRHAAAVPGTMRRRSGEGTVAQPDFVSEAKEVHHVRHCMAGWRTAPHCPMTGCVMSSNSWLKRVTNLYAPIFIVETKYMRVARRDQNRQ